MAGLHRRSRGSGKTSGPAIIWVSRLGAVNDSSSGSTCAYSGSLTQSNKKYPPRMNIALVSNIARAADKRYLSCLQAGIKRHL